MQVQFISIKLIANWQMWIEMNGSINNSNNPTISNEDEESRATNTFNSQQRLTQVLEVDRMLTAIWLAVVRRRWCGTCGGYRYWGTRPSPKWWLCPTIWERRKHGASWPKTLKAVHYPFTCDNSGSLLPTISTLALKLSGTPSLSRRNAEIIFIFLNLLLVWEVWCMLRRK